MAAAMVVLLMLDLVLDLVLNRMHAVTHVALRALSDGRCIELHGVRKGQTDAIQPRITACHGLVMPVLV